MTMKGACLPAAMPASAMPDCERTRSGRQTGPPEQGVGLCFKNESAEGKNL